MHAPCEIGNVYLSSLTKNLWYEEREQLDSGGGGALSQGFFGQQWLILNSAAIPSWVYA